MSSRCLPKIVLFCLLPLYTFAVSLPEKYPSYAYVFSEFGVEDTYIYDEYFEAFVFRNEQKLKTFYARSMKKGKVLLPLMKDQLTVDGLSDLFIYISMVESGFSPAIVSPKKAVGLWQFMPSTAKHYNLAVCNALDERCDPISATTAAVTYLRKLHDDFGKWYLAVMAYNCGEGRLKKAIKKARSEDISVLLDDNAKYLPKETRDYIRKILLVAMIGEDTMLEYAVPRSEGKETLMQVEVKAGSNLCDIAKGLEMKSASLLALNRQYKKGKIPTAKHTYPLTIPEAKMMIFYMKYDIQEETKTVKPYFISHYVVLGDTLEALAKQYHSDPEEIQLANRLKDDTLTVDSLLLIPVTEALFEKILNDE